MKQKFKQNITTVVCGINNILINREIDFVTTVLDELIEKYGLK